jgi:cation-dependent mannose-6-phosphate receptor
MLAITHLYMRLVTVVLMAIYCQADDCQCQFPKHVAEKAALEERIKPLCGRRFAAKDIDHGYSFTVGICVPAQMGPGEQFKDAAVIQVSTKPTAQGAAPAVFMLGSLNRTEIMHGYNWIMLEYEGGGIYHSSCSSEPKRAVIMITCNPLETDGKMSYIEENNNKTDDCYYQFELEHKAACTSREDNSLSAGSVICIFLACLGATYLIGGILIMRICRNAKGLNQLPNYSFWRDFGALQADGCDLVCRCGSRPFDPKGVYHGIGDRQIECAADTAEEYDEHLLPM